MDEVVLMFVTKEFVLPGCEMRRLLKYASGIEGGM
jgi:hypothetical protein